MSGRLFDSYAVCRLWNAFRCDSLATSRLNGNLYTNFGYIRHNYRTRSGHGTANFAWESCTLCNGHKNAHYSTLCTKNGGIMDINGTLIRRISKRSPFNGHCRSLYGSSSGSCSFSESANYGRNNMKDTERCADSDFKGIGESKTKKPSTPNNRHEGTSNPRGSLLSNRNNFRYIALLTGATFALSRSSDDANIHGAGEPRDSTLNSGDVDFGDSPAHTDENIPIDFGEELYIHYEDDVPIEWDLEKDEIPIIFHESNSGKMGGWALIYKSLTNAKEYFRNKKEEWKTFWNEATKEGKVVSMEPLWVVLSNTSPTTFGNAFMFACGSIFTLWKLGDNMRSSQLSNFMQRHFLASYEALKGKRYHTFLTSGK
ncbi:hypothetical protein BEWA_029220 [Theileria equi strain WA]|uniref:Uncharacterized protein n=1 Tax=Theileria equi strain WA TaxID=1537102 RepID=L0AWV5_THEEQ|nr:hypothetical protein BEWA_029220 [Theileria equi strain WA]AFZ80072.1 hypothetical protein BEWA_029220 [Theileria equi strain WA]|eukprot:XP_004829738.1 hypothetical protein BEWA_029220 [Theileria equi strain WA]